MPELPEVETVMRGLAPAMTGARIKSVDLRRPDLRAPLPERFAERLTGASILRLSRRAKYILADLDSAETLVLHLGMSGSFRIEAEQGTTTSSNRHHPVSKNAAHDHVVFHLSTAQVIYNDPRRFGSMRLIATSALADDSLFARLGLEPLDDAFDARALAKLLAGRATSLKGALLDQTLIAGLGNIYVCEALHRAALSPLRAAGSIVTRNGQPTAGAIRLVDAIKTVLGDAVAAGGSTLRDHRQADGALGYFQHHFLVYDREGEPCPRPRCPGVIKRFVQNGRSTFYCATCQR
jgi:formamidopyrimidine-DNA glycosylase